MTSGLTDEPFTGYTFQSSPPHQPRLWFLDRHLQLLDAFSTHGTGINIDIGHWTITQAPSPDLQNRILHYTHQGKTPWTAAWKLTNTTIEHITTFGRDDDVWRLALWPD